MANRIRFGTVLIGGALAAGAALYICGGADGATPCASWLEPDDDPTRILRPSGAICVLGFYPPRIPDVTRPRRLRTIVGRVVDEWRRPIEGASVVARFQNPLVGKICRNFEFSEIFGVPSRPEKIRTQTDGTGTFRLTADPDERGDFGLCIGGEGFASSRWSWNASAKLDVWPEAGSRNLGDFELLRAGIIEGEALDEVGRPIRRRLLVEFDSSLSNGPTIRKFQPHRTHIDPETGKFRIPDCAPGAGRLSITSPTLGELFDMPVNTRPGTTVHVNPVVRGVRDADALGIALRSDRVWASVADGSLVLVKSDGTRSTPLRSSEPGADLRFEGLDDSEYELRLTDPNFEPVIRRGVRLADDVVDVSLKGRGAVRVTALDGRSGTPVPHFSIEIEEPPECGFARFTDLTPTREVPPATKEYSDIALGAWALTVHAIGYTPAKVRIEPLTAGVVKPIEVRLERNLATDPDLSQDFIECTVLDADGKRPIYGANVALCDLPEALDENGGHRAYEMEAHLTDVDGRARWRRPNPGRYAFRFAGNSRFTEAMTSSFAIADDSTPVSERLVASAGRTVRGRLTPPRGLSPAGHRVLLVVDRPVPPDLTDFLPYQPSGRDCQTLIDGSFVLRGVLPGTHRAYVQFSNGYSEGESYFEERHRFPAGSLEVGRQDLDGVKLEVRAEDLGGVEVSVEVEGVASSEFAQVQLIAPKNWSGFHSFVTRDGIARFHALPPGPYRIVVDGVEGVDPFTVRDPVVAAWPPTRRSVKIDTR